ncbi:MAG: hypothetical protein EOM87_01240 [Clostridia bacterium]|nr:hypothetical protein [Clostridia bacterium]
MKRYLLITIMIAIIILTASVAVLQGCKKNSVFTVTFNIGDYGIEQPVTATVNNGGKVTKPDVEIVPSEGYVMVWYSDSALTSIFDFNSPVTSNMTLYLGEDGLIFTISYTDVSSEWFNIAELPTSYKAGVGATLPSPNSAFAKGYNNGNWFVGNRDIGKLIKQNEIGDLILHFRGNLIEYKIRYSNIDYIDLGEDNYSAYLTNSNPLVYRVTDGIVTLVAPVIAENCPHTSKVFSHWERVSSSSIREGELIIELNIDLLSTTEVFIRAVWQ